MQENELGNLLFVKKKMKRKEEYVYLCELSNKKKIYITWNCRYILLFLEVYILLSRKTKDYWNLASLHPRKRP